MLPQNNKIYQRDDKDFNKVLDILERRYYHNGGDPDAEVIINWNKREAKEDKVISFFATNSAICNAIRRCRPGIAAVQPLEEGATLYFDVDAVRPMHTIVKVKK